MDEEKLAKEFEKYQQLAQQDKKIDVASLMLHALEKEDVNKLSHKEKRWAYLISIGFPPFGLIFAVKFYFSGKEDGEHAAWICGVLTAVSILMFVFLFQILLSSSGTSLDKIQQIKPSDIQQLYQ